MTDEGPTLADIQPGTKIGYHPNGDESVRVTGTVYRIEDGGTYLVGHDDDPDRERERVSPAHVRAIDPVPQVLGQQDGDHVTLLKCRTCGAYYETDETVTNDCPACHHVSFDMLTGDPADVDAWRDDPRAFDTDDENDERADR